MIKKKSNCLMCGFYNSFGYCRVGLGWTKIENTIKYCDSVERITEKRCGTCKNFYLPEPDLRLSGFCKLHRDFRNYYNKCYTEGAYQKVEGKDLRPLPENPPKKVL